MRMKRAREPKQTVCNISNIHRKTKQFIYNSNDHSGVCAKESVCFRCLESARSVSYWSELFLFVVVFCLLRECLAYITPFIIHHLIKIHIKQTQKRKMIRSFTYEEFFHCCCCFSLVGDFFSLPPLRPNKYKFYALKYSAWDFRLLLLYSVHARVDIFYYKFTVLEVLSERNALFSLSVCFSTQNILFGLLRNYSVPEKTYTLRYIPKMICTNMSKEQRARYGITMGKRNENNWCGVVRYLISRIATTPKP